MIRSILRSKVGIIFYLMDDYTKQPVLYPVEIKVEQFCKIVSKGEGYYLIMELWEKEIDVCISSPVYKTEKIHVSVEELDPVNPVVYVTMEPNRAYILPQGTSCIEGIAAPNEVLYYARYQEEYEMQLWCSYEGENDIYIYSVHGKNVQTGYFYIENTADGTGEIGKVRALDLTKICCCHLEEALLTSYPKQTSKVYSVIEVEADENGAYYKPLPKDIWKSDLKRVR